MNLKSTGLPTGLGIRLHPPHPRITKLSLVNSFTKKKKKKEKRGTYVM